jgi:hypothetical protein
MTKTQGKIGMDESIRKLDKLDSAFLFIISLVGLLFTIIQIYVEGITGLIEVSPLLFLGVVLPFYIGYMRGAIEMDCTMERLRGWVYLAVGVGTYLAFFLTRVNHLLYWLFILFSFLLAYYLENWFDRIFKINEDISNTYAFCGTTASGVCLAFISRMVVSLYSDLSSLPEFSVSLLSSLLGGIWITYFFFLATVMLEKMSRQVVNVSLPLSRKQIQDIRKTNFLFRLFMLSLEFIGLSYQVDLKVGFLLLQGLAFSLISMFLVRVPLLRDVFLLTSMVFFTLGIVLFFRLREIDFSKIKLFVSNRKI